MAVTQKEIAKKLNISQGLVAGVLSNNPTIRTSVHMRTRVLAAAREMGYAPHVAAQMLRSGKTKTIALAYVKPRSEQLAMHHAAIVLGLAEEIGDLGYKLELKRGPNSVAVMDALQNIVRARAADAVVLWGTDDEVDEQGTLLESLGQPFIARGYYDGKHPTWMQVDWDHCGMIRQSVDKLIEIGHERIAYLGHELTQSYARRYSAGFHEAMANRLNRTVPENWILTSQETGESARRIMRQIDHWFTLPDAQRPTAIACGQGGSAIPAIEQQLLAHGIKIGIQPGHFALVGMVDRPWLVAGNACWYSANESFMVEQMIRQQLIPLVRDGEPQQRILRYLPKLLPTNTEPEMTR